MSENDRVAALLEEFADLLEARDVEFKPRAYRRAAEQIRSHPRTIESVAAEGTDALEGIEGVGTAIAEKVLEYVETGTIGELEELRAELPVDMDALTRVEGLGPKRVGALYDALGITTLDELEAAAEAGEIREVEGFGETSEANILEHLPFARRAAERHLLSEASPIADALLDHLGAAPSVDRVETAGSIRRWVPTIGDVDVLVATDDGEAAVGAIRAWRDDADVLEAGDRKASIRTADGVRVDFRFVEAASFGAALQYFTGSKDHNVQVRQRAIDRGLKVNEYGVFREGDRLAGETEADVYAAIELPWIPPELREARGEIEAADADALPELVGREDIRGDLHVHTDWSDGSASIEAMVAAAEAAGHEVVAITDHATGPGVVADTGVGDDALLEQASAVRVVADEADVRVLHGVEANIDAEGDISVADEVLERLDVVIASPHAALRQSEGEATRRLVRAVEHPAVDIVGHPTGRKLGQRPGLPIDVERVAAAAADEGVALEVNAHPVRLDLEGEAVQLAISGGASVVVSTDAHTPAEYDLLRYGVHTARRGWATPDDVVNARPLDELVSFLTG